MTSIFVKKIFSIEIEKNDIYISGQNDNFFYEVEILCKTTHEINYLI